MWGVFCATSPTHILSVSLYNSFVDVYFYAYSDSVDCRKLNIEFTVTFGDSRNAQSGEKNRRPAALWLLGTRHTKCLNRTKEKKIQAPDWIFNQRLFSFFCGPLETIPVHVLSVWARIRASVCAGDCAYAPMTPHSFCYMRRAAIVPSSCKSAVSLEVIRLDHLLLYGFTSLHRYPPQNKNSVKWPGDYFILSPLSYFGGILYH